MLNSFRNFTKSFWAKILLVIIIIPFVFWGMGGVFSGGSQNTLAKINNYNISTKNFEEHINALNINQEIFHLFLLFHIEYYPRELFPNLLIVRLKWFC